MRRSICNLTERHAHDVIQPALLPTVVVASDSTAQSIQSRWEPWAVAKILEDQLLQFTQRDKVGVRKCQKTPHGSGKICQQLRNDEKTGWFRNSRRVLVGTNWVSMRDRLPRLSFRNRATARL